MHKSRHRTSKSSIEFLPTVLLVGALLILIAAPVFDIDSGVTPINVNRLHKDVNSEKIPGSEGVAKGDLVRFQQPG